MKEYKRLKLPLGIVLFGLIFSFSILGASVVRAREVEALKTEQEEEVLGETSVDEVEDEMVITGVEAKAEEAVDYYLPYPGILPDHPFYWLKMIRDRVQLWLTNQPLAKAEKLLMYADKRLGAGWALIEGNKKELGVTTLTKGEKYLERVGVEAGKLGEGGDETRFKEKLNKARLKHQQILRLVVKKLEGEQKGVVEQIVGEEIGNE